MVGEKWRLSIVNEEWEFESLIDLEVVLRNLLQIKDTNGRLKDER